jgi:hypothetical protein
MAKDKEGHGSEAQDKAEHHGRWNMEAGKIDADEATKRLGHRYEEQASKYPTMRKDIPKEKYVSANLKGAKKTGLEGYKNSVE